jgi:hypothetical protein
LAAWDETWQSEKTLRDIDGIGYSKGEHILLRCAVCKRLRYEKQIKALQLFRLLSLEMLHRRVEIEKQDFRKKSPFFQNPADHKANLTLSPTTR